MRDMSEEPNSEANVPPRGKPSVKLNLKREQWREYLMVFAFGFLFGVALSA